MSIETLADPLQEALEKAIGFQYRIERLLGRGGMGAVYLAHELALDRDVAIKVLPPERAGVSEVRERFKREARTAARLSHPNIVPLHTFGEVGGLLYFVMGYVAGESLAARLKRDGPLDVDSACTLLGALCDALDYAHRQGIVHRDIKPDNILLDATTGAPLLTDFGIAKPTFDDAKLTTTGQLIGTPHYMSPEQALGRADVGPKSDLYSLGIVAYETLSGVRPFEAQSPLDALTQRLTGDPRPLTTVAPWCPPDLALAVARCLQRDAAARWADAGSLREALMPSDQEPEESFPARMLRTSVAGIPIALLALGYVSLYAALNPEFPLAQRWSAMLVGVVLPMAFGAAAAMIRLRGTGIDAQSILRKALQQPRWWRSWYPPGLRRRGDVWARLPREARRFRAIRGLTKVYVFGIFLPLLAITAAGRHLPSVQWAIWGVWLVLVTLLWVERYRATRVIRASAGVTATEASAILNTSTSATAAWRRTPAASLLDSHRAAPPTTGLDDRVDTGQSTRTFSGG